MDLGLRGRRVLISGAHRGTGAGIARVMAAEGAMVVVHGFEPGQADGVVAGITAAGGSAVPVAGDILDDRAAAAVVAAAVAAAGPIDILVNNYGTTVGTSWETPAAQWHEAWERNVLTGVRLAQLVTPGMRERGWGRIVFVGTIGTARPGDRNADYYGAKGALPVLARSLAKDLRGTGITVNLVSPGVIATAEVRERLHAGAAAAGLGDAWEAAERWGLEHAMANLTSRIPDPEDIGRVVAFVAGEPAWHINGAEVRVDGGALDAT